MRKLIVIFLSLAALAWSACALAHGNEEMQNWVGEHGGQMQMTGMYHVEMLVATGQVQVWVTNHANQSQLTEGATASAMVVYPGETVTVPLAAAGGNQLAGRDARIKPTVGTRVSVVLVMKGQADSGQTRYVLKPPAKAVGLRVQGDAHPHQD